MDSKQEMQIVALRSYVAKNYPAAGIWWGVGYGDCLLVTPNTAFLWGKEYQRGWLTAWSETWSAVSAASDARTATAEERTALLEYLNMAQRAGLDTRILQEVV